MGIKKYLRNDIFFKQSERVKSISAHGYSVLCYYFSKKKFLRYYAFMLIASSLAKYIIKKNNPAIIKLSSSNFEFA